MPQDQSPPGWYPDAAARARQKDERSRNPLSSLITRLYRVRHLRLLCRRLCDRLEGGLMYSATWRDILQIHHAVSVGRYSYGSILTPTVLPPATYVGNYCSVGSDLIVHRRDHPVDRPFLHPFFYNSALGFLRQDSIITNWDNPLTIGHDVWIGDRVTILGGCKYIGNGAVIAAGSVVTRDVAPYAIVAGAPARPIRRRLNDETIDLMEASRWWESDLAALITKPPVPGVLG